MMFTTLASLAAFAGIISSTTAVPVAEASSEIAARKALPFKIIVSSPHRQTLVPEYTLCNGRITSLAADAAQYYFSDTPPFGVLYCSDAAATSTTSQVSGKLGFNTSVRDFAVFSGKKGQFEKFSLATDNKLKFKNATLGRQSGC